MAKGYLNIDSVGEVEVSATRNATRLSMQVTREGTLRVTCPPGTPKELITKFVTEHRQWIADHISTTQKRITFFSPERPIAIGTYTIRLSATSADNSFRCKETSPKVLTIAYPKTVEASDPQLQNFARRIVGKVMQMESGPLIVRAKELAAMHGFKVKSFTVKDLRSRWGSCSSDGQICLNCQLLRLPQHLVDFVILHELTHLVHMNHSKDFHAMVNKLCGGREAQYEKEIKQYSTVF